MKQLTEEFVTELNKQAKKHGFGDCEIVYIELFNFSNEGVKVRYAEKRGVGKIVGHLYRLDGKWNSEHIKNVPGKYEFTVCKRCGKET